MTTNLKNKKIFLLDCDGVIWRGDFAIEGAVEAVNKLLEVRKVYFLTNNSTYSPEDLHQKLIRLGIKAPIESCIPVSIVTAHTIKSKFPSRKNVYIIGEKGMKTVMRREGFNVIEGIEDKSNIDLVVVGMDRLFNYEKLKTALQALVLNDAEFIATNMDPTLPTPDGPIPGAGSMVAALKVASDRNPRMVIGKPHEFMFYHVQEKEQNVPAEHYVMIGDRITTDILFAKNVGISSILVKSGVQEQLNEIAKPDLIFNTLNEAVDALVK